MRKKSIAILLGSILAVSIPVAAFLTISTLGTQPKVSSSYIYMPNSEESQNLKQQVSNALDATVGQNGKLDLKFDTLTQENQYTAAENSWFLELDAAFRWIDPRLSFERTPRSNATVERSFYNNNTMMRSFFWSADYHNVGTWVGYNFTDLFAITNLYPSLYQYAKDFQENPNDQRFDIKAYKTNDLGEYILNESGRPDEGNILAPQYQPKNWIPDLSKQLYSYKIPEIYVNYYAAAPEDAKVPGIPSLDGLAPANGGSVANIPYFYSWQELEQIDKAIQLGSIEVDGTKTNNTLFLRELMWNQIGYWADLKTSQPEEQQYWMGLVAWVNNQTSAIPYVSDAGPGTSTTTLATNGFHPVRNSNSDDNFRDWYVDSNVTSRNQFSFWFQTIPFGDTFTPFNPSFTRAPNSLYFQSTWNGLLNYKTIGDWSQDLSPPENKLFLQGAESINIKKSVDDTLPFHTVGGKTENLDTWYVNADDLNETANGSVYEFNIPTGEKAFNWYGPNGTDNGDVTAQDYFAGVLAFVLSAKWNYNQNGYYTTLFNMDIEETIKANNHFYSSRPGDADNPDAKTYQGMDVFKMLSTEELAAVENNNVFTLVQSSPNVNTLDVLTKQYFNPIPAQHSGVRYILERNEEFLILNENGTKSVNEQSDGFAENVYGASIDSGSNVTGWWSPGPYIVDSSNGVSEMVFKKNENYFNKFPDGFFRELDTHQDIETVIAKYGDGYSIQNNYVQFINNEVDTSIIPQANISEAFENQKDSIRTVGVEFLPRTDLITFNTDIYELDEYGIPLRDANGNKIRRSYIPAEYETAIIDDLHLGSEGNSYKIRSGIMELIDWYSLSSLATPNNAPYYQNSVVPYGNGKMTNTTFYQTSLDLAHLGFTSIPYSQYQKNWEEQLK